ncbi:MAG TPA: hypothetical protein VL172_19310 [Kofleriaceae bacterium]|jgi:hypothetical protein|nr:hypothetical protein [Kofleriaceae bacterium]
MSDKTRKVRPERFTWEAGDFKYTPPPEDGGDSDEKIDSAEREASRLDEIVQLASGEWEVRSKDGSRSFGKYRSRAEAVARLRQVEGHAED